MHVYFATAQHRDLGGQDIATVAAVAVAPSVHNPLADEVRRLIDLRFGSMRAAVKGSRLVNAFRERHAGTRGSTRSNLLRRDLMGLLSTNGVTAFSSTTDLAHEAGLRCVGAPRLDSPYRRVLTQVLEFASQENVVESISLVLADRGDRVNRRLAEAFAAFIEAMRVIRPEMPSVDSPLFAYRCFEPRLQLADALCHSTGFESKRRTRSVAARAASPTLHGSAAMV